MKANKDMNAGESKELNLPSTAQLHISEKNHSVVRPNLFPHS
jgi:hypothetical protein